MVSTRYPVIIPSSGAPHPWSPAGIVRRILGVLLLYLCICCCAAPAAVAESLPLDDDNIHINADRMSQSGADGIYTAEGNVVVLWQGQKLVADRVRYTPAAHTIDADGSVVLTKGTLVLQGDSLTLNTDTGMAEMKRTLLSDPESGMKVRSEKLVRMNDDEFTADTTEMTTCDIPDPSWKFRADNLKVNLLGYATGRNVTFYVHDVPVLYLPWIAFPVVLEKKSGLLFPRFDYSNKRGMQLDIPVYLVISPSQDILLDLDIMSRRGVGTGVDYRYIRNRGSLGHLSTYSIYDQHDDQWRWELFQEHKELFSDSANLRITANALSDRTFLDDYGEKFGDYNQSSRSTAGGINQKVGEDNRQSSDSTVNVLKTWQHYAATAYAKYSKDLYAANNRATLQTLPSLGLAGVRQQVPTLPLYADLDATVDNLYRRSSVSGQRLHLYPRITLLPSGTGYFQTSLFAGAHIRGYATDTQDSTDNRIAARDGDVLPEAGARLSTSLFRIYDINAGTLKKIRHELIPEISYSLVPKHDQQRLPFYDYTDRMIYRNMVSLAVTSLMNGKFHTGETSEYRDISRVKVSADYAIEGGRRDLLTLVESQRPWSDLALESDTWLAKPVRLTFDARYNLYEQRLSTAAVGLQADGRQGNSISAGYQMARNELEYFEGRLSTKHFKPFTLSYNTRYSFDRGDFLESVYAAEYKHKCWSVIVAVHERLGNHSFSINFNLAGLGTL